MTERLPFLTQYIETFIVKKSRTIIAHNHMSNNSQTNSFNQNIP